MLDVSISTTDDSPLFLARVHTRAPFAFAGLRSISLERRDIWERIIIALLTWGVLKTKIPHQKAKRPQQLDKKDLQKIKYLYCSLFMQIKLISIRKDLHEEVTRKWPITHVSRMFINFCTMIEFSEAQKIPTCTKQQKSCNHR